MVLSNGWKPVSLATLCEINPRDPGPEKKSDLVSFVPMPAVSEQSGTIVNTEIKPFATVSKGYTRFCDGDVIFAKITPCMENGKCAIALNLHNGMACGSTEFHVLRPGERIIAKYLWRFLRQKSFRAEAEQHMTGAVGQRRVPAQFLKEASIPLPRVGAQKRVVARLDALFEHSEAARAELARIPRLVERYRQSILTAAFRGELTTKWRAQHSREMSEWQPSAIGKFADVGTGATPKRGTAKFYAKGTIPWVTSGAVNDEEVNEAFEHITQAALDETNCKVFPPGTLLVAMYGEGQTRGKVSVLKIHAATNQALAAISVRDPKVVNSRFVFWFLKSNYLELRKKAAGGVQPNLNLGMIKALTLILPPIDEQVEIVRTIEQLMLRVETLNRESAVPLRLLERLEQAACTKAYEGAL